MPPIERDPPDRDTAERVFRCALAARLAYLDGNALEAAVAKSRFTLVAALQRGSHHAVVLDDDRVRMVGFRGTDDRVDWRTNLNVLARSTPWGRVHRGFLEAVTTFWPQVGDTVREGIGRDRRIWLTGHSLGGALAVLAAAKLSEEGHSVEQLCTFGQPPVGGSDFCRHCSMTLGERYIRCVNHTDAVVDDLSMWRQHSGTLWYFDVDGHLHHDVSFRRGLIDHVLAPHRFGGLSQFGAHAMANYLPLLQTLVERR